MKKKYVYAGCQMWVVSQQCCFMPHFSKLCYISQTFMMPQKDREQNISFKFQFFVSSVSAIIWDCTIFRLGSLLGASCPFCSVQLSSFFRNFLLFYISLGSLVPIASNVSLVSTLFLVLSLSLYFTFIFLPLLFHENHEVE